MTDKSRALELVEQRMSRHALSGPLYTEEAVYQEDLEHIWYKEWVFAGHTFEIENKGNYLTLQLGEYPIVVIRGKDNQVQAFHNVCRHRGSRLCSEAKGSAVKLVCPYHKWTYGLDGNLLFAGHMGGSFEKEKHQLRPVKCEVVNTYIFICVAEEAPDLSAFKKDLAPFVKPHNLENCKVAYESNIVEKGNWKLVFENNRECYHCDSNHPELLNSFVENLAVAGIAGSEDPELVAFWDQCEEGGMPSRLVMADDGQYRITRIPLSGQAVSYTMDGKPAVNKRLDKSGVDNIGALLYFNYPSTWNHFLGDYCLSFRMLPISSGETLLTTKWLVSKDAVEGVDYDLENLIKVWVATNEQDRNLVENAFSGVGSPCYVPGPFSDITENGVCQFVDWYCTTIKKKVTE